MISCKVVSCVKGICRLDPSLISIELLPGPSYDESICTTISEDGVISVAQELEAKLLVANYADMKGDKGARFFSRGLADFKSEREAVPCIMHIVLINMIYLLTNF